MRSHSKISFAAVILPWKAFSIETIVLEICCVGWCLCWWDSVSSSINAFYFFFMYMHYFYEIIKVCPVLFLHSSFLSKNIFIVNFRFIFVYYTISCSALVLYCMWFVLYSIVKTLGGKPFGELGELQHFAKCFCQFLQFP